MIATLQRPERCAKCLQLARRLFTYESRYVCAQDACLGAVLDELLPAASRRRRAALLRELQACFTATTK